MTRRSIVAAMSAAAAPATPLIGTWKLVSYTLRDAHGAVGHPYGEKPVGRLTYDASGRMAAQIMRPGIRYRAAEREAATAAEMQAAFLGYVAYYGTFRLEGNSTVYHKVEAAIYPNWVGGEQKRSYVLDGRRLTLGAQRATGRARVVLERLD